MKYTLNDPNGNTILSVESTPVATEADIRADLDKAAKACESAFDEVTKYQDAMAVMSSEGFGEQAKAVASKVWEKIKEFFINLGKFIKKIGMFIINTFNKKKIKPEQKEKAKEIDEFIKSNKISKESGNDGDNRIRQIANKIVDSDIIGSFWKAAARRVYLEGHTFGRGDVDRGLLYNLSFEKPQENVTWYCEVLMKRITDKQPFDNSFNDIFESLDLYYEAACSNENEIAEYLHSNDSLDSKYNTLLGFIYANDKWNTEGIPGYKKHIDWIYHMSDKASLMCDDLKNITQDEDPDIIKKRIYLSKIAKIFTAYGNALNNEMKARIALIDLINQL